MNRLTQTTTQYAFLTAPAFTVSYNLYDAASNRKIMTAPDGSTNTYTYDVLNRLATLTNSLTGQFGFGYDNLSRRNSLTRPNGVNTTYTYDPVSNLLSALHKLGTTILDGASYTYDPANNRKTRVDKRLNTTLTYTYDNLYQLQTAKQGSTTKETYTYDAVGNRLSSLGMSPYSYNPSNELTATPSASYTYDNNGNTLTKSGGTTYGWDFENRLVSAVVPGTGTVAFKYDPFGRRIQKSGPLGTTNYLYDGKDIRANIIEEVDNSGNVLARYTQSPGIDRPFAELRSGTTSYYQQDALGSVTSLSNGAGALANTYAYDSFGKLIASTGTLTNPFQYTGREFDPETGIYEYRARYYNPNSGRFISEDSIGFDGGNDFYVYVKNNPAIWIDPLGLVECTYNISTHQLHCLSDDLTQSFDTNHARSGKGLCMNNKACEKKHDQGPLPEGEYYMGPMGHTKNWHPVPRVPLTAVDGSVTYTRDAFEVHQGNDSSSTGCIVLDPDEYSRFQRFYATDNSGVMGVR